MLYRFPVKGSGGFRKLEVPYFGCPYNKDPISGTNWGPLFSETPIYKFPIGVLRFRISRVSICLRCLYPNGRPDLGGFPNGSIGLHGC